MCEVRSCSKARHIFPKGKEVNAKDIQSYGVEEYGNKQYLPYCWERECCPDLASSAGKLIETQMAPARRMDVQVSERLPHDIAPGIPALKETVKSVREIITFVIFV